VERAHKAITAEFDVTNQQSALGRLSGVITDTHETIRHNLTLDRADSPLALLRQTLKEQIDELARRQDQFQSDVREKLGIELGKAVEAARGTQHGVEFEDLVGQLLEEESNHVGDRFEATGRSGGALGAKQKVGDHVVTLGAESRAPDEKIVFECKEDQSFTQARALAELETAKKNRGAQIGVFVFSSRCAPTKQPPFIRHGDDILIVWDRDDRSTDVLVSAAYSVARAMVVKRFASGQANAAEWRDLEQAIIDIEKLSDKAAEIKTWATTVENNGRKIGEAAGTILDTLRERVETMRTHVNHLRAEPSAEG
jgi:hypothetical protein